MSQAEWLQPNPDGSFPTDRVPAEVVSIGKKIVLFDPKRTIIRWDERFQVPTYTSRILLDSGEFAPFPLDISARPVIARNYWGHDEPITRRQIITPYHPENGYIVTEEDFDPDTRFEKFKRLRAESLSKGGEGGYDFWKTDTLAILVDATGSNFDDLGLKDEPGYRGQFIESFAKYAAALRLITSFKDLPASYMSAPMSRQIRMAALYFHDYTPIDGSRLTWVNRNITDGWSLFIPSDPETVLQVQGEFFEAK